MSKVLCHNCCPSIPKGIITVESESDFIAQQLIDDHIKHCGGKMEGNLEKFIMTLSDRMQQDRNFAVDIYRALCNMQWQDKKNPDNIYSCSWRYAGGLVASFRCQGEDYIDFYCSGGEGTITKEVKKLFNNAGWRELPYDQDNSY